MSGGAAGIAMLGVFAAAAALMYARVLPALLAVPLMALGIAAVAGAGLAGLESTVVDGTVKLAPVIVTVIFGALLSRVTLSTGIAETIVTYAAEFGGDRPAVLALALATAVAVLFTSLTGLGAIIMVGSIVLPIMLTIGVPRKTAATLFMLAFALGFIFNIAQWTFYTKTFGVERAQMQPYAFALAAIDVVALVVFTVVRFRASRGYATWAVRSDEPIARKRAPLAALVTPVLPIVLYFFAGANPIVAFALAALYGALTTAPRRAIGTLVAAAIRGVEDVAPAVLLFMGIGMLLVATGLPAVKMSLEPLVSAIAPRSWFGYVVLFGLLSPLALYRGPLNPFGVGIAVYTVLAGIGVLPAVTLVAAIMAVVQVQNVCDPTNTQNVWVANFTGVRVNDITKLTLPYQTAVATVATLVVAFFGGTLLGVQPFHIGAPASAAQLKIVAAPAPTTPPATNATAASISPATDLTAPSPSPVNPKAPSASPVTSAPPSTPSKTVLGTKPQAAAAIVTIGNVRVAGLTPGLFAPASVTDTIGVWGAADSDSQAAAAAIRSSLARGWGTGVAAVPSAAPAGGCSSADYDAALRVTATAYDLELVASDCADWPVDQWYVPRRSDVRADALAALFRFRLWTMERPRLAENLLGHGLAYDFARDKPTFFYTLFKTPDGQMRAFVRPGGAAYAAGLRTNDIVEKLDGKFWWEYGTFQTQARAYDGLPHSFVVERAKVQYRVQLGEPLRRVDSP